MSGSGLGDRDARADRQRRELIDRGAAGTPVGKFLFIELRRHMRLPFSGRRTDHRAGLEPAAIDAHRAAEAAADLERRLDDGVAREARRDRFEIRDFAGRAAASSTGESGANLNSEISGIAGPGKFVANLVVQALELRITRVALGCRLDGSRCPLALRQQPAAIFR